MTTSKESNKKKKKWIYVFGYGFIFLSWFFVICLSLELFERLRWKYIEKTNKFVRIRRGELLMREWDGVHEEGIQYGEGKHFYFPQYIYVGDESCEPVPDPLDLWSYRFQMYFSEEEIFQTAFQSIYDIQQFHIVMNKSTQTPVCSVVNPDIGNSRDSPHLLSILNRIPVKYYQSGFAFIWDEFIQEKPCSLFFYPLHEKNSNYSFYLFVLPNQGKSVSLNPFLGRLPNESLWLINYFSYKPHANITNMPFRTNNFGFRDRDFKVPKPAGVFRILCIGASTTEEGISNQETYPKFLENELKNYFGKDRIEVLNCGISGMVMSKHCAKLPDYLYLQPDLVILYEGINDVVYEVFPNAFDNASLILRVAFIVSHFVRRQMRFVFSYPLEEMNKHIHHFIFRYMEHMLRTFTLHNVDMCIASVGVPYREKLNNEDRDYYDYYYDKEWGWANSTFQQYCDVMKVYNKQVREFCRKNGVLYIPIEENVPASTKYFCDICHMRQEGIKLKARIMAETLIPYLRKIL